MMSEKEKLGAMAIAGIGRTPVYRVLDRPDQSPAAAE
jgi:hypothetical protein